MKTKTMLLILIAFMAMGKVNAQTDSEKANASYKLAEEEFENGKYQNTIDYLTTAIKLNPLFETRASYLMAKSYDKLSLSSSDASKAATLQNNCLNSITYYLNNGKDENKKTELTQIKIKMESGKNTADKPSKEETIKWIADKINAYGTTKINIGIEENRTISLYNSSLKIIRVNSLGEFIVTMNINDIISVESGDKGNLSYIKFKTGGSRVLVTNNVGVEALHTDSYEVILQWDAEPNLKERMIKAITNLIEYNKENQTKETY